MKKDPIGDYIEHSNYILKTRAHQMINRAVLTIPEMRSLPIYIRVNGQLVNKESFDNHNPKQIGFIQ